MSKIDHPKVFISYAWTNQEYGQSVLDFSNRLLGDGIDVVLDKFGMHPGNEMPDFMERSVKDPSVTHVLILLNPHYKEKADKREGGVGTETQIISPEVYSDVANTKFIPVIFDREGKTIADCLPIYLGARYAIDLTDPKQKDDNYRSLIRTLYGADLYLKASLGPKPEWVDQPDIVTNQAANWIEKIEKARSGDQAKELIISAFDSIVCDVQKIDFQPLNNSSSSIDDKVAAYRKLIPIRNTYLDLLLATSYQETIGDTLSDFFESLDEVSEISSHNNGQIKNAIKGFVHECIVYTIAILFKRKHYRAINFLIAKPYLVHEGNMATEGDFDRMFYCGANSFPDDLFVQYYYDKTGQRKLSGFANYMIENLYIQAVRRDEFVDADILCTNLTAFAGSMRHPWFALTYVYSNSTFSSPLIQQIAFALRSKTLLVKYLPLFGSATENDLKNGLARIANTIGEFHFGYNQSYAAIPLLTEEIKPEDVGTKP